MDNGHGLKIVPSLASGDVMIASGFSRVHGRQSVDLSINFAGVTIGKPVWLAPMDTTTSVPLAVEAWGQGIVGVFHRAGQIEQRTRWVAESTGKGAVVGAAIGTREINKALYLIRAGAKFLVLDVADAGNEYDLTAFELLLELYADEGVGLVIGNFANGDEIQPYLDFLDKLPIESALKWIGRIAFKIGRSSGSICITAQATGVGIPLFTAVALVSLAIETWRKQRQDAQRPDFKIILIGDGGVKDGADAAKIIAAGASGGVMVGQLAAGMSNSLARRSQDHPEFKIYRGMGSESARRDARNRLAGGIDDRYEKNGMVAELVEGDEILVRDTGSVAETMDEFFKQLRAGMMAAGCGTIGDMARHKKFVLIGTDAGRKELTTHSLVPQPLRKI